jgi:60 kDa SS-A/Ro ribonucleoprotein
VEAPYLIKVCKFLSDPDRVRDSKQLPFRFLSAYRELSNDRPLRNHHVMVLLAEREPCKNPMTSMVLTALEDAMQVSVENIKGYDYDTSVLLACDVSSSMYTTVSPKSTIANYDIGLVLAMLMQNKCKNVITGIFGQTWKTKMMPQKSVLANTTKLYNIEGEVGYSTNGYKVLEYLIDNNLKMDRLMFFTDSQMWDSDGNSFGKFATLWSEYKKINPLAVMILFDLAGHGNTPVSIQNNDVYLISGWSDKIFDILHAIEHGKESLDKIKKIKL